MAQMGSVEAHSTERAALKQRLDDVIACQTGETRKEAIARSVEAEVHARELPSALEAQLGELDHSMGLHAIELDSARTAAAAAAAAHTDATAKCKAVRQERTEVDLLLLDAAEDEKPLLKEQLDDLDAEIETLRIESLDRADAFQRAQETVNTLTDSAEALAAKHAELADDLDSTRERARRQLDAAWEGIIADFVLGKHGVSSKDYAPAAARETTELGEADGASGGVSPRAPAAAPAVGEEGVAAVKETREFRDFVIRLPGSLDELDISVGADGTVLAAPGGLFDPDFKFMGIDGVRFQAANASIGGQHTCIIRCYKPEVLAGLAAAPQAIFRDRVLKMMQVPLKPDAGGFGIDLAAFNGVAGIAAEGAAASSALRVGDIITSVDGVYLGTRKLVEVLQRGHEEYTFTVVRPAVGGPMDVLDDDIPEVAAEYGGESEGGDEEGLDFSKALQDSLSQLPFMSSSSLDPAAAAAAAPAAPADGAAPPPRVPSLTITRLDPTDGNGVTIQWKTHHVDPKPDHYRLEWRARGSSEWESSDVSERLRTTLVTKGHLVPTTAYKFRITARDADGVDLVAQTTARATRPDGVPVEQSEEERREEHEAAAATIAATHIGSMDVFQSMLLEQRASLEKEQHGHLQAARAAYQQQLGLAQAEADSWKSKYLESQGTRMQAVLQAQEHAASSSAHSLQEVETTAKRMRAERDAANAESARLGAALREKQAELAKAQSLNETAASEARAGVEADASKKLAFVMKKAQEEIREKLKKAEEQTAMHVQRAVESCRAEEAKKAAHAAQILRQQLEAECNQKLQVMQSQAGLGATQHAQSLIAKHEKELADAIAEAEARVRAEYQARLESGVGAAEAARVSEARAHEERRVLAKQVVELTAAVEARDESLRRQQAEAEAAAAAAAAASEAAVKHAHASAEAVGRAEQVKMREVMEVKLRESVAERERELLDEHSNAMQALVVRDNAERHMDARVAAHEAGKQWGRGNEDFEDDLLARTRPLAIEYQKVEQLMHREDLMSSVGIHPDDDDATNVESDVHTVTSRLPGGARAAAAAAAPGPAEPPREYTKFLDKAERAVAERPEVHMLRERHETERKALHAKHLAEQAAFADMAGIDGRSAEARAVSAAHREREVDALLQRQLVEMLALGGSLGIVKAQEDVSPFGTNTHAKLSSIKKQLQKEAVHVKHLRQLSGKHAAPADEVRGAVTQVQHLERQLEALARPYLEMQRASEQEASSDLRHAASVVGTVVDDLALRASKARGGAKLSDTEADQLGDLLMLMRVHASKARAMRKMLREIAANGMGHDGDDEDAQAVARGGTVVGSAAGMRDDVSMAAVDLSAEIDPSLEREELLLDDSAAQLESVLTGGASSRTMSLSQVRKMQDIVTMVHNQKQETNLRVHRIETLRATANTARLARLRSARAALVSAQDAAAAQLPPPGLDLPCAPVAVPAGAAAINIDWLPPASAATHYHLQVFPLFLIRRHTPFSPYAAPRFPHMSEMNSPFSVARDRRRTLGRVQGLAAARRAVLCKGRAEHRHAVPFPRARGRGRHVGTMD